MDFPLSSRISWSPEKVRETAAALVAAYGPKAPQHMIDISQQEIRALGDCNDFPHDQIMLEIAHQLQSGPSSRA